MSIDRDTPPPKCWAFNADGLRCMQIAGHAGLHAHAIEWTDDECFSPIVHQLPLPNEPVYTAFPEEEQRSDTAKCVACSHLVKMHPTGECVACDCRAVIPE